MKHLVIVPNGWPCRLDVCPPGPFTFHDDLCWKTEYGQDEAYCESGEVFWGGVHTKEERCALIVQPCLSEWQEDG
jgi:hypothetical protein